MNSEQHTQCRIWHAKLELEEPELEEPVEEELYNLTPKFAPIDKEEEFTPHLDLLELEEDEASAEPIHLDSLSQDTKPVKETPKDDDLYDFGLLDTDSNEPFEVIDDEEEIKSDIQSYDSTPEEETLSDIKEFTIEDESDEEEVKPLTYEIKTAAAEIGLNAELVGALIDDYIVEANEMKNKLNDVISSGDVMRWKGYATQLKGVSDNLRIKEISDALQNLISSTEEKQAKAAMHEFYGFINQL